jgi:tetratricopeptide (TPR) repeat protein
LQIKRARLARDPGNVEWLADLAGTINKLGINLQKTGNLRGALQQFREQERIAQQLLATGPDNAQWKQRASTTHAFVASVLLSMGDVDAAEREYQEALRIDSSLTANDPENANWKRNFAVTTARVAALLALRGDTTKAEAGFSRAQSLFEDLVRRDPDRILFKNDLAMTSARQAMSRLHRGDVRGAKKAWSRIGDLAAGDTPARQAEVLLAGIAVASTAGDAVELDALRRRTEALFAVPPLKTSSDPEVLALRARLLFATGRASDAAPLIAKLDAGGYRQPDYEWTIRRQ